MKEKESKEVRKMSIGEKLILQKYQEITDKLIVIVDRLDVILGQLKDK